MKKVIPIKPNGSDLDSGTFSRGCRQPGSSGLSVCHIAKEAQTQEKSRCRKKNQKKVKFNDNDRRMSIDSGTWLVAKYLMNR